MQVALSLTVFTSTASAGPLDDLIEGIDRFFDSNKPLGIPELEFPPECGGTGGCGGTDDEGGFWSNLWDRIVGNEAHGDDHYGNGPGERRIPIEEVEALVATVKAAQPVNAMPTPVEWYGNPAKNVKDPHNQGPGPYNPFPDDEDDKGSKGGRATKTIKAHRPVVRPTR